MHEMEVEIFNALNMKFQLPNGARIFDEIFQNTVEQKHEYDKSSFTSIGKIVHNLAVRHIVK